MAHDGVVDDGDLHMGRFASGLIVMSGIDVGRVEHGRPHNDNEILGNLMLDENEWQCIGKLSKQPWYRVVNLIMS